MSDLANLVLVAPLSDEVRQELLDRIGRGLDTPRQAELLRICWKAIGQEFQIKYSYELQASMLEMAQGNKAVDFNPDEVVNRLLRAYAIKLQTDVDSVREEIQDELGTVVVPTPGREYRRWKCDCGYVLQEGSLLTACPACQRALSLNERMETIFTEKARKIQLPTRKNMANTQAPSPVKKSPEVKRPEVLRPEDI